MSKSVLQVKNSFCKLINFPKDIVGEIHNLLTYQNDIEAEKVALLKKLKYFKNFKDSPNKKLAAKARQMIGLHSKQLRELEATEFVHWLNDNNEFPTGHLNIVVDALAALESDYRIDELRVVPKPNISFVLREPFPEARYYQEAMHNIGLSTGRGVFESAVGTGKSLILMRLLEAIKVKSLIVVPSKPLMYQLKKALEFHFGERNVIACSSATFKSASEIRIMKKCPIRITNIQALASLNKAGTIDQLIEDIDAIFIDEIHHAGSKSYTDLLPKMEHIYYRFGFTGTFLRNDSKTLDMWGFLSNRLYHYPAHKAIEEGFLTPVKCYIHKINGIMKKSYQKEYEKNYCGSVELLDKIKDILENYVDGSQQVLILVNRKDKAGLVIHEYLEALGYENTYISGDNDKEDIDSALDGFNKKKIKILIGSTVIGEGIDIRSTDHLIMAQGGKSEIAIVQAVGRLVRLFDGKEVGYLHDFRFSDTKYMEKHLEVRKSVYQNNFSPKFLKAS